MFFGHLDTLVQCSLAKLELYWDYLTDIWTIYHLLRTIHYLNQKEISDLNTFVLTVADDSTQRISFEVKLYVHVFSLRVRVEMLDRSLFSFLFFRIIISLRKMLKNRPSSCALVTLGFFWFRLQLYSLSSWGLTQVILKSFSLNVGG